MSRRVLRLLVDGEAELMRLHRALDPLGPQRPKGLWVQATLRDVTRLLRRLAPYADADQVVPSPPTRPGRRPAKAE